MKVEFYETREKNDKLIGTVSLVDGKVVWSDDFPPKLRKELELYGVRVKGKLRYKPEDGAKFLEWLPFGVSGDYVRAKLVPR